MEVLLFRALTQANIDPDTAQKVVDAVEEHIDMAVGQANQRLEAKLDGMTTSMDTRFDGIRTSMDSFKASVDQMRVWLIIVTSIIAVCALAGTILGVVNQITR
ncbi:hypothetical protein [Sphingomonas sp. VNH70]|uniref:hypothetical protein n=1 Tax=Sphingomonas silueang TaxID=3156617 RepID=UPI0028E49CA2|nr:hypothetical protein [uncultured Sphingomonas sp.]